MQFILNRFNEKYQKESNIHIRFFDENPLSIRRIRYNQSGAVCYCMSDKDKGKQKVSNIWKNVNCSEDCKYKLSTDEISKPQCNLEGTLKFLLPDISTDRIFIMKITGQTSIKRLQSYFDLQKQLGNSLIGDFILFLKQEEQINKQGKVFNNYILDIIKKSDFSLDNSISNNQTISKQPVANISQTVDIDISKVNESQKQVLSKEQEKIKSVDKKVTIIEKTVKEKKQEMVHENVKSEENKEEFNNTVDKHYTLLETNTENLTKNGHLTEYTIADFINVEDKIIKVIISPEFSEELLQCDIGTEVILDLATAGDKIFTNNIQYVQKCFKNVVA